MIFIVDSNVIFSALIRDSYTRALLINPPFMLYIPESVINEIRKHEDLIIQKSGLAKDDFELLLELILENIDIIEKEKYRDNMKKADKIIGNMDKGDIPFIALALSVPNNGIWTEDNHFEKQKIVKVWKTKDIIDLIEK